MEEKRYLIVETVKEISCHEVMAKSEEEAKAKFYSASDEVKNIFTPLYVYDSPIEIIDEEKYVKMEER